MKTVFFGSKTLGLTLLQHIIANLPNKSDLRLVLFEDLEDPRSVWQEYEKLANDNGIELVTTNNVKPEFFDTHLKGWLSGDNATAVVCGWYSIIPSIVLAEFSHGVWGVHHSLLPKYRGGSPLVWQILNDEAKVGTSVFRLAEGVDEGPVLAQYSVSNNRNDHIGDLLRKLEIELVENVDDWLAPILSGSAIGTPQAELSLSQMMRMRSIGDNSLLASEVSKSEIVLHAKALNSPYPGLSLEAECGCFFSDIQFWDIDSKEQSRQILCRGNELVMVPESRLSRGCELHGHGEIGVKR